MKASFFILLLTLFSSNTEAQEMDNDRMGGLLSEIGDTIRGEAGLWEMVLGDVFMICITDQVNNRMRIISPIKEMTEVTDTEIGDAMEANFHSALDVRYAISDNVMWVAFIHPLHQLSEDQVIDAVSQVYSAALTFGTDYASTHLSFPKAAKEKNTKEKKF